MRTQALLLLLAVAPAAASFETDKKAALVAFKAKTDGLFKIKDFKSTTTAKKSSVFGSTLLAADDALFKCHSAIGSLYPKTNDDEDKCRASCKVEATEAETDKNCHESTECKAFQKKCASEAGWGFFLKLTTLQEYGFGAVTMKFANGVSYCYPSECEGLKWADVQGEGSNEQFDTLLIKEGPTTTVDLVEGGSKDGMSFLAKFTFTKNPPPMWFYIVIVGAVAAIIAVILVVKYGCCCCCKKKQADVPAKA
jgi:hypothetical protein